MAPCAGPHACRLKKTRQSLPAKSQRWRGHQSKTEAIIPGTTKAQQHYMGTCIIGWPCFLEDAECWSCQVGWVRGGHGSCLQQRHLTLYPGVPLRFAIGDQATGWCFSQGCQAIVDTGTFLLAVPQQYLASFLQATGAQEAQNGDVSNQKPRVSLHIWASARSPSATIS